ncbi:hypothetical protein OE903_12205 [Bacillus sp. B6(2022)]|nr:hypothetical protein [Bacillus sp. B6(2022)]
MDQVIEDMADPNSTMSMNNIQAIPWDADFLKGLGVIPCPYHRYYYKTSDMLAEEKKQQRMRELVQKSSVH